MMRVAWRTSVLVAFCLLTSTATAHAECAWVMWTEERHADGGLSSYRRVTPLTRESSARPDWQTRPPSSGRG
jgi:hypothetical protein